MTIDEAIEMLQEILNRGSMPNFKDDDCVLKLGIEALKHIKYLRSRSCEVNQFRLPGETETEEAHSSTG